MKHEDLIHYEHPSGTALCKVIGATTTTERFKVDCLDCVIAMEKQGLHNQKRDPDEPIG